MRKEITKKTAAIFLAIFLAGILIWPATTYAKNPLRDIVRGLRRTTSFVIKLPDKATRWMGPVIGPIASGILTQNLSRHAELGRIFRNAREAQKVFDNIDEQRRVLNEVKGIYRAQASDLESQIEKMQAARNEFAERMINDPDYGVRDYMNDVIEFDRIIGTYRDTADNLRRQADRMNTGDIIKLLGRDAIRNFLSGAEAIAVGELNDQINRFINPDIIKTFLAGDAGGVLDVILAGDIKRLSAGVNFEGIDKDELIGRIKDRIRELATEEKENLKNNWQNIISQIVKDETDKIRAELPAAPETAAEEADGIEADTAAFDFGPILKDEHGCLPGYVWQPRSGVGCVQEDCPSVANAHWSYEGYCVCGSSGSINENPADPNKSCFYPRTYRACPGCVYACVHASEECPELPSEGAP